MERANRNILNYGKDRTKKVSVFIPNDFSVFKFLFWTRV